MIEQRPRRHVGHWWIYSGEDGRIRITIDEIEDGPVESVTWQLGDREAWDFFISGLVSVAPRSPLAWLRAYRETNRRRTTQDA